MPHKINDKNLKLANQYFFVATKMSEKLANDPHDCRCPSTSTVIIDAQNAELGYHHRAEYLTGFDRQLESVIGLGKMSDFTRVGKLRRNFIAS